MLLSCYESLTVPLNLTLVLTVSNLPTLCLSGVFFSLLPIYYFIKVSICLRNCGHSPEILGGALPMLSFATDTSVSKLSMGTLATPMQYPLVSQEVVAKGIIVQLYNTQYHKIALVSIKTHLCTALGISSILF